MIALSRGMGMLGFVLPASHALFKFSVNISVRKMMKLLEDRHHQCHVEASLIHENAPSNAAKHNFSEPKYSC